MYQVEFCKERLSESGHVIDEEIGRLTYIKKYSDDGRLISEKIGGTLYGVGCKFSTKKSAEQAAEKFKKIYEPYPEFYRVTTEVYHVNS